MKYTFRLGWWAYTLVLSFWLAGLGALSIVFGPAATWTYRSESVIGVALLALGFTAPGWLTTWALISEKTCIVSDVGFSRIVGLKRRNVQWSEISSIYPNNFQMVIRAQGVNCRFALVMYENPRALIEYVLERVRCLSVAKE